MISKYLTVFSTTLSYLFFTICGDRADSVSSEPVWMLHIPASACLCMHSSGGTTTFSLFSLQWSLSLPYNPISFSIKVLPFLPPSFLLSLPTLSSVKQYLFIKTDTLLDVWDLV